MNKEQEFINLLETVSNFIYTQDPYNVETKAWGELESVVEYYRNELLAEGIDTPDISYDIISDNIDMPEYGEDYHD